MGIEPALDVGHHYFLVDVVEEVVKVTFVELERFVGRAGLFIKVLAAAWFGRFVKRTVQDEDRQGDKVKFLFEPLVGAHHHRGGLRRLILIVDQGVIVH